MRLGILLFACLILGAIPAAYAGKKAAAAGASIEGSWSGSGTVTHGGATDQVRCRVRYTKAGGNTYTYNSTCATDTGRYELTGRITSQGANRYSGVVTSPDYKGSGRVVLFQRGNSISVTASSGQGTARISLSR